MTTLKFKKRLKCWKTFGSKKRKKSKSSEKSANKNRVLMSVCVSSSLSSGMTHVSHLHLTSTLSMMQSFQNHHQMVPSSTVLSDMALAQQSNTQQLQMQNSSSSSSSDANEPNSEMLLALIARNKTLEGESPDRHRICRRKKLKRNPKSVIRENNTTRLLPSCRKWTISKMFNRGMRVRIFFYFNRLKIEF